MSHHPNYKHQREAIEWARAVLGQPQRYVILDTETTGVTNTDEVIQIGIIDPTGAVLLDHLLKPFQKNYIPRRATEIHGITMAMLWDKPHYGEITHLLKNLLQGRTIVTYNAVFDRRLVSQSAVATGGFSPSDSTWECAMLQYAQFVGDRDGYRNKYRWHKLRGGDHTAVGDCKATLALIDAMAVTSRRKYSYETGVQAEEVVAGSEASLPPPRLQRASRPERGSGMPAFGISISLDGGVQYFGREYTPPTPEEQDAELSEGYRQKLRAYEQAHSLAVSSIVGVVQFLASSYRSMTEEEVKEAGKHLSQPRVAGYGGRPAVRCFTLIKKMETATPKRLYGYAVSLKSAVDEFSGQGSRDAIMRAEAATLRETVEECGRNELLFRSQIIWSNEWDRVRDRLLAIEKKAERKKGMNDFIKKLKELCDARSFRGLKEERERFIEYVKAQFEHE